MSAKEIIAKSDVRRLRAIQAGNGKWLLGELINGYVEASSWRLYQSEARMLAAVKRTNARLLRQKSRDQFAIVEKWYRDPQEATA